MPPPDPRHDLVPSGSARDAARRRIEAVLSDLAFTTVLQPVADLRTGVVVGAEALSRFSASPPRTPDVWFAEAWEVGLGVDLELATLRAALALQPTMPSGAYLALNVSPRTLTDPRLDAVLRAAECQRLVLELTEHDRVDDYAELALAVGRVRAVGVRLAVDDAGAGFASFQHILRLRPDLIKLDRDLTRAVDTDAARNALASALVTFAANIGPRICAEGIETEGELEALRRLGVDYGQGYLLGRPAPAPVPAMARGSWDGAPTSAAVDPPNLDEQEQTYRAIFEHAAIGVLVTDEQGIIVRCNEHVCRMLGFSVPELQGAPLARIKDPETGPRELELRRQLLEGARAHVRIETRYRARDGALRWARVSAARISEPGRAFTVAFVEDIDEGRKAKEALEQSERRYRTLVQHLPNASVVLFDRELRFVLADGAERLHALGFSTEPVVGRTLTDVASGDNLPRLERAFRATLAGHTDKVEIERAGRWVQVHTVPVRSDEGTVTGGMVMTYDISALKHAEAELRVESGHVALLHDVAVAANSDRSRAAIFETSLRRICEHLGWQVGHVFVLQDGAIASSNAWYLADERRFARFRADTLALPLARLPAAASLIGQVFASGRLERRSNLARDPRFLRADAAGAAGLRGGVAVPVIVGERVLAVLELYATHAADLDPRALQLLRDVGVQLGRVIERERHAAAVQALVVRDELTGLLNRRGFLELGHRQLQLALRSGRPFALLFVDLDGMKTINDELGHKAGDSALCDAATILRGALREVDLVARLGGDEFVALVVDAGEAELPGIEARLRRHLDAFNAAAAQPFRLSISLGAAVFDPASAPSLESLLADADARMYAQKRSRRDTGAPIVREDPLTTSQILLRRSA